MNCIIFYEECSPSVPQNKNAESFRNEFPGTTRAMRNHYVDDVYTLDEAIQMEVTHVHKQVVSK